MSGIVNSIGAESGVIRKHKGINEPAFHIAGGGPDGTNEQVTSTGYNLVDWTTPVIDTGSYWDAGNNKFLPTDGVARQYWIYCTLSFTTSDDIEPLVVSIRKNDVAIIYTKNSNHTETTLYGYGVGELNGVDQYLTVQVYNPTGTGYEIMTSTIKTFFGGYALDIT